MSKQFVPPLIMLLLFGASGIAQSSRMPRTQPTTQPSNKTPTQPPSGRQRAVASPGRSNFFETESYRVTIESVRRKANNFTVTFVFESLLDKVIGLKWGNSPSAWEREGPYLIDEKQNKYTLQGYDSAGIIRCGECGSTELLPKTKLKTQLLFFGPGNGTTFTFMTTEYAPSFRRSVTIRGVKVTSTEELTDSGASPDIPSFVTESYRVVVTDVQRDSENITVTMVFENLLSTSFKIEWGKEKKIVTSGRVGNHT